jgi:L-fuculose-phosphate aldolase
MDLAAMKELLAYACKVLAFAGQKDGVWGHVSLRLPEKDLFLMKPSGFGLEEITADDIITVSLDGQKVAGDRKIHSEVPIHSEILKVRSDVNCVVHTHPAATVAFSALGLPLLPLSSESCIFYEELPVYSATTDLIREKSRGQELAACLGNSRALLLQNHGIVTVGQTAGEAVMWALFLDKACQMQLATLQCGGPKAWATPEDARGRKLKHGGRPGDGRMDIAFNYFVRQVKLMESSAALRAKA